MMRLFLGFAPDDAEMRSLYDCREGLALAPDLPLGWTPEENWHITLCFLGELENSQLSLLSSAVTSVVEDRPPLDLRLDSLEWFPSPSKARLLATVMHMGQHALQVHVSVQLQTGLHGVVLGSRWNGDFPAYRRAAGYSFLGHDTFRIEVNAEFSFIDCLPAGSGVVHLENNSGARFQ